MKRPDFNPRMNRHVLSIIGVIVLAAITAVLVLASLMQGRGEVPAQPQSRPSPTPDPVEVEPEPTPAPPEVAPVAVAPQRLIVASSTGGLLRSTIGACPGDIAVAEASFDGGQSWESARTEGVGVTRVLSLSGGPDGILRMASLDAACAPQSIRSFVGGTSWEVAQGELADAWYLDIADPAVAHTPAGVAALPCAAVSVVGVGAEGVALCADTGVTVSADAGASWSAPVPVPGAAAVAPVAGGVVIVSSGEAECTGVRARTLAAGALSEPGACLELDGSGGNVAATSDVGGIVLWAGESIARSSDGGVSWQ